MLPTTSKVAMLHAIQPPATRPFVINGARTDWHCGGAHALELPSHYPATQDHAGVGGRQSYGAQARYQDRLREVVRSAQ